MVNTPQICESMVKNAKYVIEVSVALFHPDFCMAFLNAFYSAFGRSDVMKCTFWNLLTFNYIQIVSEGLQSGQSKEI